MSASKKKKRLKTLAPGQKGVTLPSPREQAVRLMRRDHLVLIEGIDPTTEMALNSLGIRRFADFRGYSPESLSQALQERTGVAVSAKTIESQDWLGWAEILAAEDKTLSASTNETEIDEHEAATNMNGKNAEQHVEPPKVESPIVIDADYKFTEVPEKPLAENVEATLLDSEEKPSRKEITLHVKNARFAQFERMGAAGTEPEKMLRGEISCELLGAEGVENLAEPIYLNAQIHTTNTATGEHALLAATAKQIQPGRTGYRLELEFRVPSTGRYQLQIVAFLLQAEARIAYHQGPFLRVIPQNSLSSLPRVAGK